MNTNHHQKTELSREAKQIRPHLSSGKAEPEQRLEESGSPAFQRTLAHPEAARPAEILELQQAAGNQAVHRLIQARLNVGAANDSYEQEADRIADQVMAMPAMFPAGAGKVAPQPAGGGQNVPLRRAPEEEEEVQTKPLAAAITPLVQRAPEEEEEVQTKALLQRAPEEEEEVQTMPLQRAPEEEEEVQTKPAALDTRRGFEVNGAFEDRLAAGRGSGSPLSSDVRAFMEPRFGVDFSGVHVHSGSEPAQLNQAINAQAFTHGQDIYLGGNSPAPGTPAGDRLLAHELTHVIQQSRSGIRRISRWGGPGVTQHKEVFLEGYQQCPANILHSFSPAALAYLADHCDDMDLRIGLWLSQAWAIYLKQKVWFEWGKRGMYEGALGKQKANLKPEQKKIDDIKRENEEKNRAYLWDNIAGYSRDPGEMPNHAEAGMYKTDATSANIARRDLYIDNAITAFKTKNPRQALYILALALHTAQDRGSHGDGKPGLGHDPRQVVPPPNNKVKMGWIFYGRNRGWKPGQEPAWQGSDCDRREKNKHGFDVGVKETVYVLTKFVNGLDDKERQALKNWTEGGILSKLGRSLGRLFGGKDVIRP